MVILRSPALRQAVAAVILVALTLSGVGRSLALADDASHPIARVAGVPVMICHTDSGNKSVPGDPGRHDCCEACALCVPFSTSDAAPFVAPARVEHFAAHAAALTWAPAVARIPTPRLSQGPPAA